MLLRRLVEYSERLDLPPSLYSETPIRYVVLLDSSGRALSRTPFDTADPASPATRRGVRRQAPQVARSVGIKPLLLADNAEYTFGLAREESRPERVRQCHAAYLALVDRCARTTGAPSIAAIQTFLEHDPLDVLELPEDFDAGALLTFQVEGEFPIDARSVQEFWAAENDPAARGAQVMQCLVCGESRPVLERLQAKVKGVPGGQTTGTSIISANASAFESYGLEASLIAPTCASCGERFTKAANALLGSQANRMTLGGAAFVFWTREDVGFSFRDFFDRPGVEEVRALLSSLRSGGPRADVDDVAFYATVLSGSGGRAVVRDWIDTTIGAAKHHLAEWFEDQVVVERDGADHRPLGLFPLAAATVRDASKELAPPTTRALLRSALTGTPLSLDLLARAVRRTRADGSVSHAQASLIKLVLSRRGSDTLSRLDMSREEIRSMIRLVPDHPSQAYHCGRLLAVLDAVQRAALGRVNATVVDRYFGTASSAPGTVFPYLIRGSAPHLSKLRKTRPGTYQALEQRLEEVLGRVDGFRPVLTLEDQGLFALGFYHQRAHDREQARLAAERKRAGTVTTDTDTLTEEDL
ncbi:MAG: type I-C CRISPR-associated protein Cas8c/Csd1 [Chloroflexi bacterium]|nr:type I-C CRISPR-associated protein Cas8c/Csd1 [Chloroflexota bacterium]